MIGPLVICVAGGSAACGGDATGPESTTGTLKVTANTTGETPDEDGYTVSLDGRTDQALNPNGSVTFTGVAEGSHQLELSGLQVNCDTDGSSPRPVSVTAGETTSTTLDVFCPLALLDQIGFERVRDGNPDIYSMEADGSSLTEVTRQEVLGDPSISPDGSRIVFEGGTSDSRVGIVTADPDGTDLKQVIASEAFEERPAWSPDGARIAFSTDRDGDKNIYTIRPDGTGLRQVTDHSADDVHPAWSPDGNRIAFRSSRGDGVAMWTINSDGTGSKRVVSGGNSPAWSPDGNRIAFQSNGFIWTIHPDGSRLERVTDIEDAAREPAWSPDGTYIVFASNREGDDQFDFDIWKVNLDDGSQVQLTDDPASDGHPDWGPGR